ncbi:glycosyltransferase family A protein [Proteus penneri]|uniref:glycosyltransferase family A protein n=1 Tax=Proteus penneri TaxID=102862 RepID=UPI0018981AB7|nr:glycosyltransferase family A protein [Proteus penneri]
MNNINISVIIPVYNKDKFLIKTLSSIISQINSNDELIIINDGSTDNSQNIINNFYSKYNSYKNIKIFNRENQGVSFTRNEGASHAENDYLLFVDADDILLDNAIERLKKLAKISRFSAATYEDNENIKSLKRISPDKFIKEFIKGNIKICVGSIIIHKELFNKYLGFNTSISHGEDQFLWLKIGEKEGLLYSNEKVITYNRNDMYSLTQNKEKPINITGQVVFFLEKIHKRPFNKYIIIGLMKNIIYCTMVNINNGFYRKSYQNIIKIIHILLFKKNDK